MLPDEEIATNKALLHAVDESLAVQGWKDDNVLTTDVVVLIAQRGWEGEDGVARVIMLTPTDTPDYAVLGMMAHSRLQIEEQHRSFIRKEMGGDEE